MEKISIIIPVYNASSTLEKCINSIINQTYKNLEVILVDDCSTDNSWELCKKMSNEISYLQAFHLKENKGPSAARNFALDRISGKWISFVDSDDYLDKYYYENLIKIIKKSNSEIIISSFIQVDENENILREYYANDYYKAKSSNEALEIAYGRKDDLDFVYNLCWNKLYKKEIFDNVRFPIGRLQEDAFIMPYLIYNAKSVDTSIDSIYYYVDNHSSISYETKKGDKDFKRRLDLVFMYNKHMDLFKNNNNLYLYYRCQLNLAHNIIAIYRLHYIDLKYIYSLEFENLLVTFRKNFCLLIKNKQCSLKSLFAFGIFACSPNLFMTVF